MQGRMHRNGNRVRPAVPMGGGILRPVVKCRISRASQTYLQGGALADQVGGGDRHRRVVGAVQAVLQTGDQLRHRRLQCLEPARNSENSAVPRALCAAAVNMLCKAPGDLSGRQSMR